MFVTYYRHHPTHMVALATCHNRKANALSPLNDLYFQELPEPELVAHVLLDVVSTDRTDNAIKEKFPDV